MADFFSWIVSNWGALATILGGLLGVASLITALTPTPKDDEVVRKIASYLSFLQPRTSAGTMKVPGTAPAPEAPFSRLDDR